MTTRNTIVRCAMTTAMAAALVVAPTAPAAGREEAAPRAGGPGPCAERGGSSGEWPSLNADLSNTRHQPRTALDATDVPKLAPSWVFRAASAGLKGKLLSTPIVAGGCVFLALNDTDEKMPPVELGSGRIVAVDAEDGSLVWVREVNGNVTGLAAAGGKVFALPHRAEQQRAATVGPAGPHALALDQSTGEVIWVSQELAAEPTHDPDSGRSQGHVINASPVVFDGMVFVPLSGASGDGVRVPLFLLDAATGQVLKEVYAISEEEAAAGYAGSGVWSTAAVDLRRGHLYAGTADSEGHRKQHPRNNAVVKIDVRRGSPTFGTVIGHYSGTPEQYVASIDDSQNPVCGVVPDAAYTVRRFDRSADPGCAELDLDFGASPTLVDDERGSKSRGGPAVIELQKSGVVHAVDGDSMAGRWTRTVSYPTFAGNSSTGAYDGQRYYVSAGPNVLAALDPHTGEVLWQTSTPDLVRFHPLTVANDVLYTTANFYAFEMFDTRTGRRLASRNVDSDSGELDCRAVAGGVAVAYDTVFVPCDWKGALIAYRPVG